MKNPEFARAFSDVDVQQFGFGGLGGAAAEDHLKVTARPMPDGVKLSVNCDNCGAANLVTIEWPEAVVIGMGQLPPGWKFEAGHIRPDLGCANCNRLVKPGVTPDEAKRWVQAGLNARFPITQQAVQQATRGGMR